MYNPARFKYLLNQYEADNLTLSERLEFLRYLDQETYKASIEAFIQDQWNAPMELKITGEAEAALKQRLLQELSNPVMNASPNTTASKPGFWNGWQRVAAIFILCIGVGILLWFSLLHNNKSTPALTQHSNTTDIQPGSSGALLVLADGTELQLDSVKDGSLLAASGINASIQNGQLIFQPNTTASGIQYNTLKTPKGRQYQLQLSDGSIVWMNAMSAIRFPESFSGATRRIEVQGEVYLQVAPNAKQPFMVQVGNELVIEVLGTDFNINAYEEAANIATTLISGSIKVQHASQQIQMQAGEQVQLARSDDATDRLSLHKTPNIEQVVAWKNGFINVDGQHLQEVMQQISRWYNVEITYAADIPEINFSGEMDRKLSLLQLLKLLDHTGLKFKLQGKQLYVSY